MTDKKKHSKADNKKITNLENRVAPLAIAQGMLNAMDGGGGVGAGSGATTISDSNLVAGDDNHNSGIIFSPTINVAGASADNAQTSAQTTDQLNDQAQTNDQTAVAVAAQAQGQGQGQSQSQDQLQLQAQLQEDPLYYRRY